MSKNNGQYGVSSLLLFLIYPFLGFIRACARLQNKLCGVVFVAFYTLFGYAHSFSDPRADAYRKFLSFGHMKYHSLSSVWDAYRYGELPDPYQEIVFVIVKNFTNNPHIMMGIIALIGGIFIYMTIRRMLRDYNGPTGFYYFLLIFMTLIIFSPVAIGGIRQYTTLGIVSYASIRILLDKRYWWFAAIVLAAFIHFAALVWIPVVGLCTIARFPRKLLFYSAVICCVFGNTMESTGYRDVFSAAIQNYIPSNEAISDKASYYSSNTAEKNFRNSRTTKLSKIQTVVGSAFFLTVLFIFRHRLSKLKYPKHLDTIWRYMLYFSAFGYTMVGFSVVGGRYMLLSTVFFMFFLLMLYSYDSKWKPIKAIIVTRPIFSCLSIVVQLYNIYCLVYPELFYAPIPAIIAMGLS